MIRKLLLGAFTVVGMATVLPGHARAQGVTGFTAYVYDTANPSGIYELSGAIFEDPQSCFSFIRARVGHDFQTGDYKKYYFILQSGTYPAADLINAIYYMNDHPIHLWLIYAYGQYYPYQYF
jgi:hypothetical protein